MKWVFFVFVLLGCLVFPVWAVGDYVERSPVVLLDETFTGCSVAGGGSGSYSIGAYGSDSSVVVSGGFSYKVTVGGGGSYAYLLFTKTLSSSVDATYFDRWVFWIYGSSSGAYANVYLRTDGSNYWFKGVADNFSGWKQFSWGWADLTAVGSPDKSDINLFSVSMMASANTWYFDRVILDGYSYIGSQSLGVGFGIDLLMGVFFFSSVVLLFKRR